MGPSLEGYKSFVQCQIRCSEKDTKRGGDKAPRPFVTISRQTGAGGITVGLLLVEYLNKNDKAATCPWTVFDKDLVKQVLETQNLPKEFEKFMEERKTPEMRDIMETLIELHPPAFALVRRTSETILQLAQMGQSVIVGRGGNVITWKLKGGIHVRIIGSIEKRIKHTADYYGLTHKEAEKQLREDDKGRKEYLKQNFNKDIDDPLLYDLTLNTDHISYQSAAKIIGDALLSSWVAEKV